MAKNVVDYDLFVGKKEEIKRIHRIEKRKKRLKRVFWITVCIIVALVAFIFYNSKCDYYRYTEVVEGEDNVGVSFENFASGYLKYSISGIEYQKRYGYSEWNEAITFQRPYLATSKNYAVYGDRGGNTIALFDTHGLVLKKTLRYPLIQASVSNQGNVEVTLKGTDSNYIQVYDRDGLLIAEIKSTIDETGYPVTAALSPDGVTLAVSFYAIDGIGTKTTVAFYDLSSQMQNNSLSFTGAFDYPGSLIPRILFLKKNSAVAVGDDSIHYYDISATPKEIQQIEDEETIKSIFYNKDRLGVVYDHSANQTEGEGVWKLCIFDERGRRRTRLFVDMNFDEIKIRNRQIIAFSGNECTIMNLSGKILFHENIDGDIIEEILPSGGFRNYRVIFSDRHMKMKLKFLGDKES